MARNAHALKTANPTARQVRQRIEAGGERFWTYADFASLPFAAVAKSLSRLAHEGALRRSGKGIYFHPRATIFGESQPSELQVAETSSRHPLHPSGITAANILGFTTQNAAKPQYATTAPSAPSKLASSKVATRRSTAREELTTEESAFLEFLWTRGRLSEYPPEQTARMTLALVQEKLSFDRLARAALSEPPRVRAMLGAIGEELGQPEAMLRPLRTSLNSLSRFDFGPLGVLKHAKNWQAK